MHNAIDYLNKFLEICHESKNTDQLGLAYKRLSEVESKSGNTAKAIEYLGKVLSLGHQNSNRSS